MLSHPLVFDVDDAIWLQTWRPATSMRLHAVNADVVMAGNSYIADWFSQHSSRVVIVPTAIDCSRFRVAGVAAERERFVVGWTGTHWNLKYLEEVEAPLCQFMSERPNVDLHIVCNIPPVLPSLPVDRVKFIKWTPDSETTSVQGMDIGIMPLPDDEWCRGKCSCKMLQYMACGVPVIVSPVGLNAEILASGECGFAAKSPLDWHTAFEMLYADRALARRMGACGRSIVEAKYSTSVVAGQIADVFSSLA
jgi:glycosyltransferase involved in cell wall biosynthesis